MAAKEILALILISFIVAEARWHRQQRSVSSICNRSSGSSYTATKIMCYCINDLKDPEIIRSADCYLNIEDVKFDDLSAWTALATLKTATKLTLTDTRGIAVQYIPTNAIKHLNALLEIDIKHGNIELVHKFAFANHSNIEEISLRGNQIKFLEKFAFAHHKDLIEIKLDKNNIEEINRDVFMDLPSLEKLFLTDNQISTIHDKAFVHLYNLRELEINVNKLFSLNNDTFTGLRKLLKLDLSNNNLEVIGDNTFAPLYNLQYLNLEDNKIQMLDEKAFFGMRKLQHLSLAHNKMPDIEYEIFKPLVSLRSLSLRANEITELKTKIMAPLLENFYGPESHLDVEDNMFPCDCRLDWFLNLMNRTQSKNLKITMENIKCLPDPKLREKWANLDDSEKSAAPMFDVDSEESPSVNEYEYYDETQLNGKLFYTDVRDLIPCVNVNNAINITKVNTGPTSTPAATTTKSTKVTSPFTKTTKVHATQTTTTVKVPKSQTSASQTTTYKTESNIRGGSLLDLSKYETTEMPKEIHENEIVQEKKPDYTTTRFVTVSAKPVEKNSVYENMAADEAKPDRLKSQIALREEVDKYPGSSGRNSAGCLVLISLICFRLFH